MDTPPARLARSELPPQLTSLFKDDPRFLGMVTPAVRATPEEGLLDDFHATLVVDTARYSEVRPCLADMVGHVGRLIAHAVEDLNDAVCTLECLYLQPAAHITWRFCTPAAFQACRPEPAGIVWERGRHVSRLLEGRRADFPAVDPQWMEDRFWLWAHRVGVRLERGALFAAVEGLAVLRHRILVPLLCLVEDAPDQDLCRLEQDLPDAGVFLGGTVPRGYDAGAVHDALHRAVDAYEDLRARLPGSVRRAHKAEKVVRGFLDRVDDPLWASSV